MTKALVCIGLAMALTACAGSAQSTQSPGDAEGASTESSAASAPPSTAASKLPDFELETLDGDTMKLSDQLGKKVILLDFWATFCDPCLLAMPHLNDLYKRYEAQGFVILGVSIDGPESLSRVRSEVRKMGVEFPILLDPETEALALYNPKTSAPYSILIDREGNIIKKKEGFSPSDVPVLEKAIVDAL